VEPDEARSVLNITPAASATEIRDAYLRLIRARHPDRAGDDPHATEHTARITQAYAVIIDHLREHYSGIGVAASAAESTVGSDSAGLNVEQLGESVLSMSLDFDSTFTRVFEAAGRVGHIAYFDRNLGIVEAMVRFEGGPTCSVLMMLKLDTNGTEIACSMESIEAAATPPIEPVLAAVIHELRTPHLGR